MKLKNKIVVITGASKGLGKSLAKGCIREGARVIISARNRKELATTARTIGAISFPADVTREQQMVALARFAQRRFGVIDLWINNAGTTIPHSTIGEIDPKAAHRVMEVNFFGTFNGLRAVIPIMERRRSGTIVNIISMSALVGRPRSLVYSASKWAARGLTDGIRMALKNSKITVIAVHPGGMKTTIFGKHPPKGYEHWMETSSVANIILNNIKRAAPKLELVINK